MEHEIFALGAKVYQGRTIKRRKACNSSSGSMHIRTCTIHAGSRTHHHIHTDLPLGSLVTSSR